MLKRLKNTLKMKTKQQLIVLYLDYLNNYLSLELFAFHNGLKKEEAVILLEAGKKLNEL